MPKQGTAQVDEAVGLLVGGRGWRKRHYLFESFMQSPGLNADVIGTTTSMAISNKNFEASGTNATAALCALDDNGGIKLTTAGADNDQTGVVAHTDTDQTSWFEDEGCVFDTDQAPAIEVKIKTGSAITDQIIWAGLAITHPATYDVSDDADRVVFDYDSAAATNGGKWRLAYSVAGTDYTHDTGLTVVADTTYVAQIFIREDRYVDAFIGDANDMGSAKHVRTANKMTANILTLIPGVFVEAQAAAAKHMYLRYIAMGFNNN